MTRYTTNLSVAFAGLLAWYFAWPNPGREELHAITGMMFAGSTTALLLRQLLPRLSWFGWQVLVLTSQLLLLLGVIGLFVSRLG